MPRVVGGSLGGGRFLWRGSSVSEGPRNAPHGVLGGGVSRERGAGVARDYRVSRS